MVNLGLTREQRNLLNEFKNVIIVILTVIDLVFIFLSTAYSFSFKVENYFADYDFLVCLILFIDLAYDFYTYKGTYKEFFIDDKNIISLISLFPFDLIFRYFAIFRLFRFLKLIKLIRIWNIKREIESLNYFIQHHLFRLLFIIFISYTAISSVLLILFDDAFSTLEDAFWYTIITTTTVGYGDITPVSPIGRSLSIITIIIGIVFVAILTAYLTSVYNKKSETQTREAIKKDAKRNLKYHKTNHQEITRLQNEITSLKEENRELKNQIKENNKKLDIIIKKIEK